MLCTSNVDEQAPESILPFCDICQYLTKKLYNAIHDPLSRTEKMQEAGVPINHDLVDDRANFHPSVEKHDAAKLTEVEIVDIFETEGYNFMLTNESIGNGKTRAYRTDLIYDDIISEMGEEMELYRKIMKAKDEQSFADKICYKKTKHCKKEGQKKKRKKKKNKAKFKDKRKKKERAEANWNRMWNRKYKEDL